MMMLHYREVCGVFLRSLIYYFLFTAFLRSISLFSIYLALFSLKEELFVSAEIQRHRKIQISLIGCLNSVLFCSLFDL